MKFRQFSTCTYYNSYKRNRNNNIIITCDTRVLIIYLTFHKVMIISFLIKLIMKLTSHNFLKKNGICTPSPIKNILI